MIDIHPGSRKIADLSGYQRKVRIICRSTHNPDYYLCEDEKSGQHYLVAERDLHELEWQQPGTVKPPDDG
jgi:hypothetical protein